MQHNAESQWSYSWTTLTLPLHLLIFLVLTICSSPSRVSLFPLCGFFIHVGIYPCLVFIIVNPCASAFNFSPPTFISRQLLQIKTVLPVLQVLPTLLPSGPERHCSPPTREALQLNTVAPVLPALSAYAYRSRETLKLYTVVPVLQELPDLLPSGPQRLPSSSLQSQYYQNYKNTYLQVNTVVSVLSVLPALLPSGLKRYQA